MEGRIVTWSQSSRSRRALITAGINKKILFTLLLFNSRVAVLAVVFIVVVVSEQSHSRVIFHIMIWGTTRDILVNLRPTIVVRR